MTHRMVRVLADGLPPESAYKTAIRDRMTSKDFEEMPEPEGWGPWSRTDELLAVLCDRISWLIYTTTAVAGGKPAEPEPVRRPGIGQTGRERRYQAALTQALIAYTREHDGAYPPPDWDHGVRFEDFD
jgi:hypothetical protein